MYDYEDRMNADRGYFYDDPQQAGIAALREMGVNVPTKMEVCNGCDGRGSRALHGIAISGDQLDDIEFMEDYMDGKYDTPCVDCKGRNVQEVADLDRLSPKHLAVFDKAVYETNAFNAESLAEMRAGC